MSVTINRRLNLVQPIETEGGRIYLHSTPISDETWEEHYLVLAKTYSTLLSEGLNIISGPRIAKLLLKDMAQRLGHWTGDGGVEAGLLGEIYRLTNVVMPNREVLPYDAVRHREIISKGAIAKAEGVMVFFTSVSSVLSDPESHERSDALMGGLRLWNAQTSSLDCTAYRDSLPKLMPAETTPSRPKVSSIPQCCSPPGKGSMLA